VSCDPYLFLTDSDIRLRPERQDEAFHALLEAAPVADDGHWQHPALLRCTNLTEALAFFGFVPELEGDFIIGLRAEPYNDFEHLGTIQRFCEVVAPFLDTSDGANYLQFGRSHQGLPLRIVMRAKGQTEVIHPGLMWPID